MKTIKIPMVLEDWAYRVYLPGVYSGVCAAQLGQYFELGGAKNINLCISSRGGPNTYKFSYNGQTVVFLDTEVPVTASPMGSFDYYMHNLHPEVRNKVLYVYVEIDA